MPPGLRRAAPPSQSTPRKDLATNERGLVISSCRRATREWLRPHLVSIGRLRAKSRLASDAPAPPPWQPVGHWRRANAFVPVLCTSPPASCSRNTTRRRHHGKSLDQEEPVHEHVAERGQPVGWHRARQSDCRRQAANRHGTDRRHAPNPGLLDSPAAQTRFPQEAATLIRKSKAAEGCSWPIVLKNSLGLPGVARIRAGGAR